jgi:hypothetical protein
MPSKQTLFFATAADIKEVIQNIESSNKLKYQRMGLLEQSELKSADSLLNNGLGIANAGDNNLCTSFLVIDRNKEIVSREIPQKAGGIKFAIDQLKNPAAIEIRPAGVFESAQAIIEGRIATASADIRSAELFSLFSKALKSKFVKLNTYFVGKEAFKSYEEGWRLTQSVPSPKDYDLKVRHN